MRRGILAALVSAAALLSLNSAAATDALMLGPDSNLPVPRFVSLKTEGANGRRGPGLEHQVDWVYERAGLPLRVTGESGPWRRVVDPDGDQVWMHAQNLDQRRTAYVQDAVALRRNADEGAQIVAYLSPGVVAGFTGCDGDWRRVTIGGRIGWVPADAIWGADCASNG